MTFPMSLPEDCKIVDMSAGPVTTNGGVTSDYINLGLCHKAWVYVQLTQAVGHATVISMRQAQDAATTGAEAISNAVEIWANEDTAASDTLVRQTAAKTYTVTNDVKKKLIVFEIDPAKLDINNSDAYLHFTVSDSSQATNFVSAVAILQSRYSQASVPGGPTVIT